MDALISIDVEGNFMLQTACNNVAVLAVAMLWHGRSTLVHVAGASMSIRYRDEIVLHVLFRT